MRNILRALFVLALAVVSCDAFAAKLTYLSCDLPAIEGHPATHFDFTLNEAGSTVSFYVQAANATNIEKAVFGPDAVTWTFELPFAKITRTINRVDLSFTQVTDISGVETTYNGSCKIAKPAKRAF